MSRTRSALVIGLVALAFGAGVWLTRPTDLAKEPRAPKHEPASEPAEPLAPAQAQAIPASVPIARPELPAPRPPTFEVAAGHPHAPHLPGMAPHPQADPERERLHSENRLIQSLNDAMSFRRAAELRALLTEYRQLDPTDVHSNQAGYAIIADCIDTPGDASLAAAHDFYENEHHSTLRRFVRRICFENGH